MKLSKLACGEERIATLSRGTCVQPLISASLCVRHAQVYHISVVCDRDACGEAERWDHLQLQERQLLRLSSGKFPYLPKKSPELHVSAAQFRPLGSCMVHPFMMHV